MKVCRFDRPDFSPDRAAARQVQSEKRCSGAQNRMKKSRRKRYNACGGLSGGLNLDIFVSHPNRNPAQRIRFGSEEQQNERGMSF